MKIIRLSAANFKRLVAVEIAPSGNVVAITGKNGAGKTSILDSIWAALAGASAIQPAPIRDGEDQARIQLDLGEIVVTRTFRRDKDGTGFTTKLVVQNADGAQYPSPQRMLDDLLGALTFDPLAFARMDAKGQFAALRRFVPDVDFEALDAEAEEDYDRRRDLNRLAKEARAQAAGIAVSPALVEDGLEDEAALVDALQAAVEHNAAIDQREAERRSTEEQIKRFSTEAAALRRQAENLDAQADALRVTLQQAPRSGEGDRRDVQAIRAKIDRARAHAGEQAKRAERQRLTATAAAFEKQAEALTERMGLREIAKREAIAAAKMPVPGLDFGEEMVLLNGVPFQQASDAEQLRASVAIAMASNPKLRVVRIRDGSLLDSASLGLIASMAAELDFQVWLEAVDESGKVGIVIEDGAVVSTPETRGEA